MAIKLIIQGTTYNYPSSGEDPNWAEETSSWAQAVTDALELLVGPNDILQTSFVIDNNQTSDSIIRGLYFNPTQVRAANINYSIYRSTDSGSLVETGDLLVTYDANNASGQKWQVSQRTNGNSDVLITVNDSGQFYYTSSNMTGTNYSGIMKFTAKALSI
jgi:hypothetical protein